LQADVALTGGQNQMEIWQAFARRGMGVLFDDGGTAASSSVTPSFTALSVDPIVINQTPRATRQQVVPVSSINLNFSEPIDPGSFSLASDVAFTGPGAANLNSSLTGFSFGPDNRTLTINFTPTTVEGAYGLTIGPNILAADDGHAMDQNANATPGEAADTYVATFTYGTLVSDNSFGYKAGQWAFENINLQPGGPGVTTVLSNNDDSSFTIPLGSNTFTFYNTIYSSAFANAVNVSDNGFVSFETVSTFPTNTDFLSPLARRFAPLWDDWQTFQDANDCVLYRFDDLTGDGVSDRLVIEWNDVHDFNSSNGVTFQAILQLNTGSPPGTMIANYVDIQTGSPGTSNGAGSSVGIKDDGSPPPNRLLVTVDDGTFPWLGDGKAIRIATDWTAPTATSLDYFFNESPPVVKMQFSENVGATLTKADLTVTNTTTSQIIPQSSFALVNTGGPNNGATLSFPGFPNGAPPDGNYSVAFNSAGITDSQGNPLGGTTTFNFFVLAGDADHDRDVDVNDLGILASNWQQSPRTFAQGDFDYSGTVDVNDLGILASHWQQQLALPSAPVAPAFRRAQSRLVDDLFRPVGALG
jgi:hypothetical protein